MLLDKSFTGPPPREVLIEVAKQKNCQPLPTIKPHSGLRLPPDRHCLLAANYKLRAASAQAPTKKIVKSALSDGSSTIKTKLSTSTPGTSIIKKPGLGQTVKTGQSVVSIPKPVFKVAKTTVIPKPRILPTAPALTTTTSNLGSHVKMEIEVDNMKKRKRSDDFDDN